MSHESRDPRLERLLAAERGREPPPDSIRDAVLARVSAIARGEPSACAPSRPPRAFPRGLRAGTVGLVAAAFAAGAAAGAWIRGEAPPRIVYVATSAPSRSLELPAPSAAPPRIDDVVPKAPNIPVRPSRSATPILAPSDGGVGRASSLAAERALVDTARIALARGDHANALAALERHEAEFPNGQLAEEREVTAVQVLVAAGRKQAAVERGARFRLRHPTSALVPVVDEALR
jgi:hypothetical protein